MPSKPFESRPPTSEDTRVQKEDLKHLEVLHKMLQILNDSMAGAEQLSNQVERFRALHARVMLRFRKLYPGQTPPALPQQLAKLGNREFEKVLFELLEDLTVLRSEME